MGVLYRILGQDARESPRCRRISCAGGGVARGAGKGRFFFYVREVPWPAVRGMVDVWLRLLVLGSFAHPRMCKAFFPTRGKEPKGDRWQPNRDSTMAAPGPLVAWLEGGTFCCARLLASSRGRLGTALGVMSVVRWRPGGTGGPPSLRAGWWAFGRAGRARGSFARDTGVGGCSFPLVGKNQRAPGGSQTETAPWLPPDSSPLGLGAEPLVERG